MPRGVPCPSQVPPAGSARPALAAPRPAVARSDILCNIVTMKHDWVGEEVGRRGAGRRGRGRPRHFEENRTTGEDRQRIRAWFAGRLAEDWFVETPEVTVDDDEILVVGRLAAVDLGAEAGEEERSTAAGARIGGFREDTREQRV